MREILFRGKRKTNSEWVYGGFCYENNNGEPLICPQYDFSVEVIPETIGQFIGLLDKNGTKIFEGDIIKFCKYAFDYEEEKDWDIEIGHIKYENGCFVIDDIYSSDGYNELSCVYAEISYCDGEYYKDCIFEVIGNIYDNPELLEDNNG